ncbi:MAG: WXG100 family type VII secretion target [Butyrivibrio sp.]|jgi:WXG100 family type VII secretion target|nr:WXG100 family type VII secretion target [Butyrivibrio sp.]
MANVIRVTPEELKSSASRMEAKSQEIEIKTQQMTEIANALTGRIWSGEAQTEYIRKFNGLQDDIARMHNLIKEHVEHLHMIANEYQTTENANKDTAATLSSDVIV